MLILINFMNAITHLINAFCNLYKATRKHK